MNPSKLSPDDPRLTAYALGELDAVENAEIAAAVQADPGLQAAVAETRALAGELTQVLGGEPAVAPAQPAADPYRRTFIRFPYYLVSGLAAAGFAVVAWLQQEPPAEAGRQTFELNFASEAAPSEGAAAAAPSVLSAVAMQEAASALRQAPVPSSPARAARAEDVRTDAAGNGFLRTAEAPRSMVIPRFDPDGYARVRAVLAAGGRPAPAAVHVEDLINHFTYDYASPADDAPFAADLEVAGAPWNPVHRLVRIGLRARASAGPSDPADLVVTGMHLRVDFNPQRVASYRLIGYESGGASPVPGEGAEMRAGQMLTALFEIVPVEPIPGANADLLTLRVGYRLPEEANERSLEVVLADRAVDFSAASPDFKFVAAVAGFGLLLQDSPFKGGVTLDAVQGWAEAGVTGSMNRAQTTTDPARPDFVRLVRLVRAGTNG